MLDAFNVEISRDQVCTNPVCQKVVPWKQDKARVLTCSLQDKSNNLGVQDLIRDYLADTGYDRKCQSCQSNADVRSTIESPDVLVLQAGRAGFKLTGRGPVPHKFLNEVTFDEEAVFDLGGEEGTRYELCGAGFHWGRTIQQGHYTVAARGPSGRWAKINDNKLTKDTSFGELQDSTHRQNVALLVYRKTGAGPVGKGAGATNGGLGNSIYGDQPMVLESNVEICGQEWSFSQQLASASVPVLPNSVDGQNAKVRLRLTEITGDVLEGEVLVQLQKAKSRQKPPPKTGKQGSSPGSWWGIWKVHKKRKNQKTREEMRRNMWTLEEFRK